MIGKVVFKKNNPKGFFGFIKCPDGATHYFDTGCVIKGNFINLNAEVEFDIIPSFGGKTKAINIRLVSELYSVLQLQKLRELFFEGDYTMFLKSPHFINSNPLALGTSGIEMSLKALAGYLGEDIDRYNLNDLHKILISTPTVSELRKYKDDERIQVLGAETAFVAMTSGEFSKVFANVYNGKKTLNNNWNGIIERFWASKSNLAVYLTALWVIISRKENCVDLYIEEAFKERRINDLPLILKIYSDFVLDSNKRVSSRLTKKIIGHCFDCNDTRTLIEAYRYFDTQTLPEISEVIEYISGLRDISEKDLVSWFHSNLQERIGEKITNYYWWKEARDKVNSVLLRVLSTILSEYPTSYYTEIIYNQSCPLFNKESKEQILVDSFNLLCKEVKTYEKNFVLVCFVYFNYIKPLGFCQ